jgi:hypothetical protein
MSSTAIHLFQALVLSDVSKHQRFLILVLKQCSKNTARTKTFLRRQKQNIGSQNQKVLHGHTDTGHSTQKIPNRQSKTNFKSSRRDQSNQFHSKPDFDVAQVVSTFYIIVKIAFVLCEL